MSSYRDVVESEASFVRRVFSCDFSAFRGAELEPGFLRTQRSVCFEAFGAHSLARWVERRVEMPACDGVM